MCEIFLKFIVEPPTCICKPSKRLQEIDPHAPITPAWPNPKRHQQPAPTTPVQPLTSFASCQIQASQNCLAATVLFTPHGKKHHGRHPVSHQPPSPTPHQPAQQPLLVSANSQENGPPSGSGSDIEDEVGTGMQRLNLQSSSSSGS